MTTIGYARVSTKDQSLDIQISQLEAAGCTKIFNEKISGASGERPQLKHLMKSIRPGDVVIITRLDRLARSTRDLLNIVAELDALGGKFRSIEEPWCDTTSDLGQLMMTILGGLAEFERKLIMSRTKAGIERARENGVQFGRKQVLTDRQKKLVAERYASGQTMAQLAYEFEVSVGTIHNVLHAERE